MARLHLHCGPQVTAQEKGPMPKLIRLYIVNVLIGFAISALFLGLVLALDVAGLRHLMLQSPVS